MKANKIVYRKGTFTDYTGVPRNYVFAAVSVQSEPGDFLREDPDFTIKSVGIGFSIVHHSDLHRTKKKKVKGVEVEIPVYDEKIGEQIAAGKAQHPANPRVLFTATPGMINTKVVEALLEQEEAHFLCNPKDYIANYERDRTRYNFNKLGGDKVSAQIDEKVKELNALQEKQHKIFVKSAGYQVD
jgi:hypothetical protein